MKRIILSIIKWTSFFFILISMFFLFQTFYTSDFFIDSWKKYIIEKIDEKLEENKNKVNDYIEENKYLQKLDKFWIKEKINNKKKN